MLEPIQMILRELRKRSINPGDLDALEVFGYTGEYHTKFYAPYVRSLDVWEIDKNCEVQLRLNLPTANIKITNSFEEIKTSKKKYNLIVVDNPNSMYEGHCEHFDLFPDIFSITENQAILIIDVIPEVTSKDIRNFPGLFSEKHLMVRKEFYKTANPAHLSCEEIVHTYKSLCEASGYNLDWCFFQKRTSVYYLVCRILRVVK
jgi:hypothetical protein